MDEKSNAMEDNEEVKETDLVPEESFVDDLSDEDEEAEPDEGEVSFEAPLTEEEILDLIDELLQVETKAAEAQEALEEEALKEVEEDVRAELDEKLQGDEVKEEDDISVDKKLQLRLKRRRRRRKQGFIRKALETESGDKAGDHQSDDSIAKESASASPLDAIKENICNGDSSKAAQIVGLKRLRDEDKTPLDSKRSRAGIVDCDGKTEALPNNNDFTGDDDSVTGYESLNTDAAPYNAYENFHCTACGKIINDIHQHPFMKVIVCGGCKSAVEAKMLIKDSDLLEFYCGWCGRSDDLIDCRSCKRLFCKLCIKRNIGVEYSSKAKVYGWQCCCCSPILLKPLTLELEKALGSSDLSSSSSDTESDSDGVATDDVGITISPKTTSNKKIRRILDDTELGEETKRKIAMEKERQERLKSLKAQFSGISMINMSNISGSLPEGATSEVLGDVATGFIVNVARERGEEAIRIPPSISAKLKTHQVAGIRFMWENIIQSIRNVKSGDKGLGCILAHTMGLGKTLQVIAFLYTALRSVDLGLKTALVVAPVNVLHNWRQEFRKWEPKELKPLRVYMLEDKPREKRAELLKKWITKGGVFLIGYTAFRNLSLGKHVKDRQVAKEICHSLQICYHPWILQLLKERGYARHQDPVENFLPDGSSSDENTDSIVGIADKTKSKTLDGRTADKTKSKTLDGRTSVQQFAHLASQKNYHLFMDSLDGTGALTHAFAAHPKSVQLLRTYPSVILMDSTYKTNRYKMPFFEMVGVTPTNKNFLIAFALMKDETESSYVWVLSMLKNLIGDDGFPRVILTDRELGLLNAVTRIFPSASHFLCTYHIRIDVNKKVYYLTGKNKQLADSFEKGRWLQVMRAASLQDYESAINAMETSWASFPNILDYVRQTWLVYKEKFVKYWTNMATHFGNTTTNRVESQHSSMKSWLGTSRGSIDSIFERADACATVQILGIKKSLADSMDKCRQYRVFPFQHLKWRVTDKCLVHLQEEKRRIKSLGVDPTVTCGCVIRSTHGIPCACEIWIAMRQNRPFSPRSIDPFWSTLVIGDGVNFSQAVDQGEDDVNEFQELVQEMSQQDQGYIRECNRFMRNTLHPEQTELREPMVRENVRGRPRRSAQERSQTRGGQRSASTTRRTESTVEMMPSGTRWKNRVSQFPFYTAMPPFMMKYLSAWWSPEADGNCGFRAVAHACHQSEEDWRLVRQAAFYELQTHADDYAAPMAYDVDNGLRRINFYQTPCPQQHWMTVHADLFLIAQAYSSAVMFFHPSREWCITILPWRNFANRTRPTREICLIMHDHHYILVRFTDNCPVPPITAWWTEHREEGVEGWDLEYVARIELFNNLWGN